MRKNGKNVLSLLLALVMALGMMPGTALAADGDFVIENGVLTGYTGPGGAVTIPDGVTSIGIYVFSYRGDSVTSVTIPNSVTSIGDHAFQNCTSMTSVTIPNSVTSIGEMAFHNCEALTSVAIPDSVTSIGEFAFSFCKGLTSVTIPNSISNIERGTFDNCTSLTSVTIPDSVTSIGGDAFSDCTSLTSATIPSSVTSIGYGVFSGCTGLTNVTIPNSVTSIEDYAFEGCTGLTSVTIPNSVTIIGNGVFSGCTGLTSVSIPNSVTSIGERAFHNCEALTSVTIPDSVTRIKRYAFEDCVGLASMTIPASVTRLEYNTFAGCTGLTSVTIPGSVTCIEFDAFTGCKALTDVYFKGTETQWQAIKIYSSNDSPTPLTSATIHYNSTGPDSSTTPTDTTGIFIEVHQFKNWDVFTNTVYFHDGTSYPLENDNASIDMNATLNQWVKCMLRRTDNGVQLVNLDVVKPLVNLDVKITLDPRSVEYSGGKLRFEDGDFEGKHKFEIPITVTVTNKTAISGVSESALKQNEALAITLNDLGIIPASGFNLGWFGGGKLALKNPVSLKVGESWTSEKGYIRAGTWFKPENLYNEYNVHVTAKTDKGDFKNNQKYSITNLDLDGKSISDLADKAGNELKRINTNEFVVSGALIMMYDLGFNEKSLDTLKREIIAEIVMSNAPKKTFQQKVSDSFLSKVFSYKRGDIGATTYDLPLTYIITSPNYGNVKLKLTCHIQDYDLQGTTFGKVINIDYQVLQPSSRMRAKGYTSGQFGAIYKADVKAFSNAAYNLAEAELKKAFDTGWGNSANEVGRLIFGDTVTAILDKFGTNYGNLTWRLSTWPSKSVSVRCPVDVFVYDEVGELCGSIENNKVTKSSDAFELLVVDDDKHIVGLEDGYTIKYVATGNGSMSVEITEFYGYDCPMQAVEFHDVPLTTNKEYSQDIPETILPDVGAYDLTSDSGQTLQSDETLDLMATETGSTVTFTDVPSDSWYNDAVYWAVEQGITAGTSTNPPTFTPNRVCTETEILTFLWRANGEPDSAAQLPFTPKNSWAEDALRWAYEKGMIGAAFNESTPCTRASTAKFLWQAAGAPSASGSTFTDVPTGADYAQAVAWAVAQGITQGTGNGAFSPNKTCTRAEIVTFLYRDRVDKS